MCDSTVPVIRGLLSLLIRERPDNVRGEQCLATAHHIGLCKFLFIFYFSLLCKRSFSLALLLTFITLAGTLHGYRVGHFRETCDCPLQPPTQPFLLELTRVISVLKAYCKSKYTKSPLFYLLLFHFTSLFTSLTVDTSRS